MSGNDTDQLRSVNRWRAEGGARDADRHATQGVLPLAVRQRLWDQLWQRLLAPVPDANQRDTDGEGR